MKLLLVLLALLPPALCAQQPTTPQRLSQGSNSQLEEIAVRQISQEWLRVYNAGDAQKVAALYTADAYYLSAHVLAHGREAIQAYFERGIKGGGHIDFIKPISVFIADDLAYCPGTYQATNAGVTVDGRILIVLRKVEGRWLIAAHETVVRDQP
ncbi:MAG TPA: SgcJ/EcaC family oxidoreductase [Candidatus Acidoferrum sp.]|nr:SgcJ/EcaC family oxidoreductase [Candidatus Acidoferrum sp.]